MGRQRLRAALVACMVGAGVLALPAAPAAAAGCYSGTFYHSWGNVSYPPYKAKYVIAYCARANPKSIGAGLVQTYTYWSIRGFMDTTATTIFQTGGEKIPARPNGIMILPADVLGPSTSSNARVDGFFRSRDCIPSGVLCSYWNWHDAEFRLGWSGHITFIQHGLGL
jgi:hypothetical protein